MKKIIVIIMILCQCIFGNSFKVLENNGEFFFEQKEDNLLYVIELFQEETSSERLEEIKNSKIEIHVRDLNRNYFHRVGIIEKGVLENKEIESFVKEGARADINGEIFNEFNKLLKVNFYKCDLEIFIGSDGKKTTEIPLLIKKLDTRIEKNGTKIYRALALIDKETYEKRPPYFKYPGILKNGLEEKSYICPEYYNGE